MGSTIITDNNHNMEQSEEWVADENEKTETEAAIAVQQPAEGEGEAEEREDEEEEEPMSPMKTKDVSPSKTVP
jgi:hypothetical protein